MCGTRDMGRKSFFCRTHFFSYPRPLGGVTPEKNIPPGIKKIPPPLGGYSSRTPLVFGGPRWSLGQMSLVTYVVSCHVMWCSHHITCLCYSLAFLYLAIWGTSACPTCHLQHEAVGGPFSMACFAAQWHEPANNMHCRHGWYLCLRAQRPPSTPSYASCRSTPPSPLVGGKSPHAHCMGREPGQATGGPRVGTIARHGRSVGAPSQMWTPQRQSSHPAVPVSLPLCTCPLPYNAR